MNPVHVVRDDIGICEVLGRCRLGKSCKLDHAPKAEAVKAVRLRVFELYNHACYYCGRPLTFETGHMHEDQLRRGRGGRYSITNSVAACPKCHEQEHPEKKLYWKQTPQENGDRLAAFEERMGKRRAEEEETERMQTDDLRQRYLRRTGRTEMRP